LICTVERRLYRLLGDANEDEAERELDALTDIIWRVVYLSAR
jgi:hypothetical protein